MSQAGTSKRRAPAGVGSAACGSRAIATCLHQGKPSKPRTPLPTRITACRVLASRFSVFRARLDLRRQHGSWRVQRCELLEQGARPVLITAPHCMALHRGRVGGLLCVLGSGAETCMSCQMPPDPSQSFNSQQRRTDGAEMEWSAKLSQELLSVPAKCAGSFPTAWLGRIRNNREQVYLGVLNQSNASSFFFAVPRFQDRTIDDAWQDCKPRLLRSLLLRKSPGGCAACLPN